MFSNSSSIGDVGNSSAFGLPTDVKDDWTSGGVKMVIKYKIPLLPSAVGLIVIMIEDL